MNQEEAFLADIADHPDDDAPRLVYADWLDDHGDSGRADLIRLQCRLAHLPPDDPERPALEARLKPLLHDHRRRWGRPLFDRVEWGYSRGLPEQVTVAAPAHLLHNLPAVLRTAPVRWLRVTGDDGALAELLARPELSGLDTLILDDVAITGDVAEALAAAPLVKLGWLAIRGGALGVDGLRHVLAAPVAPALRPLDQARHHQGANRAPRRGQATTLASLRTLYLGDNGLTDTGAQFLAASRSLPPLRHLSLLGNGISAPGVRALAQGGWLRDLEGLSLGRNPLFDDGGVALAQSPVLGRLESVYLHHTQLGPAFASALARSDLLARTRWLILEGNQLGAAGARSLGASPRCPPLVRLDLAANGVGDEGVAELARWPALKAVASLDLSENDLTAFGLKALLSSGHLASVRDLLLRHNRLGDLGAQVLARWPGLAGLRTLDLHDTRIDDEGARALAGSPHLGRLGQLNLTLNPLSSPGWAALRAPEVRSRIDVLQLDDP